MDFLVLGFAPRFVYFDIDDEGKVNRRAQIHPRLMKCAYFHNTRHKLNLALLDVTPDASFPPYPYTDSRPRP